MAEITKDTGTRGMPYPRMPYPSVTYPSKVSAEDLAQAQAGAAAARLSQPTLSDGQALRDSRISNNHKAPGE
jgi:hypothetical protein